MSSNTARQPFLTSLATPAAGLHCAWPVTLSFHVLPQAGPPLALDRDACGVTEAAVRSGRAGASASRVALGYEVQRRRHGGASVMLHSGVEVGSCTGHGPSHAIPFLYLATPVVCHEVFSPVLATAASPGIGLAP